MKPMEYSKMLLKRGDCALVVIDVQERLVQAVQERENLVGNLIKLVKFAQLSHLPIVITEQQKLGPTVPEISSLISPLRPISAYCRRPSMDWPLITFMWWPTQSHPEASTIGT